MKQWKKPASQNRRAIWTVALAMFLAVLVGSAFAGSHFVGEWMCGPFYMEVDGTVLNADGDSVGWTELQDDGTAITTIHGEKMMVFLDSTDQTPGAFSIPFQPVGDSVEVAPVAPKDEDQQ